MIMINKKTKQRLVASIGKIGIEFHLSHFFSILISMVTLCPLIDIDARIKFMYINSSHINY